MKLTEDQKQWLNNHHVWVVDQVVNELTTFVQPLKKMMMMMQLLIMDWPLPGSQPLVLRLIDRNLTTIKSTYWQLSLTYVVILYVAW